MTSALASSTNSNYGYYQWKSQKNVDSQEPFEKAFNKILKGIEQVLTSNKPIKDFSTFIMAEVFELRMMALAFLANRKSSTVDVFEALTNSVKALKTDKRLEILIENALFAIRCNRKVVEGFAASSETSNLSIDPLLTAEEATQKFMELISSSFFIEFSIIALDVIHENKKIVVTDDKINELASLVAEEAQNYIVAAMQLGFVKKRISKQIMEIEDADLDPIFIQEQKKLADLGLEDFAKIFAE